MFSSLTSSTTFPCCQFIDKIPFCEMRQFLGEVWLSGFIPISGLKKNGSLIPSYCRRANSRRQQLVSSSCLRDTAAWVLQEPYPLKLNLVFDIFFLSKNLYKWSFILFVPVIAFLWDPSCSCLLSPSKQNMAAAVGCFSRFVSADLRRPGGLVGNHVHLLLIVRKS